MSQWVPFLSLFPLPQRRFRICHRKYVEFCAFQRISNFFPSPNRYLRLFTINGSAKGYGPLFKYTLWLIRCLGCLEYIVLSANAFTAIFLRLFTYNLQSPQALLSL